MAYVRPVSGLAGPHQSSIIKEVLCMECSQAWLFQNQLRQAQRCICAKGPTNDTTHGHCAWMLTMQHKIKIRTDRNIGHNTTVNTSLQCLS